MASCAQPPLVCDWAKDSLINVLSREILELFFEYVHITSPSTLVSLTQVNIMFYSCANPLRHRHQILTFREGLEDHHSRRNHEIITSLLMDPAKKHILLNIRSITVMSTLYHRSCREARKKKWLLIADLLSKITHLKRITLQGNDQMPVAVLGALEKHHAQAHLHIENWTRLDDDEDHNNTAEIALARSPNLRSLQALYMSSRIDLRKDALMRIVALSPNLELLDLSDLSRDTRVEERQEEFRMREKFLDDVVVSSNSIRSWRSRGANQMTFLSSVTDTTKLHTLDVGYVDISTDMRVSLLSQWPGNVFPQLKHLSFALGDSAYRDIHNVMDLFLQGCPSLESLSITDGATHIPLSTILLHRATLRTLILHEVENSTSDVGRSISKIQGLSANCGILEDITIDVDKMTTGQSLNEVLSTLATFPQLHTIRIYVRLGMAAKAGRTPHIFLNEDETRAAIEKSEGDEFDSSPSLQFPTVLR